MTAPTPASNIERDRSVERRSFMPKRLEHLIDEALLHTATLSGMLYVQRRTRRVLPKVAAGTAVLAGVGIATATAAAGVGAAGLAGGAAALYRKRERARSALAAADPSPTVGDYPGRDSRGKDGTPEPAATEMEHHG
jgi:hypothetical protein